MASVLRRRAARGPAGDSTGPIAAAAGQRGTGAGPEGPAPGAPWAPPGSVERRSRPRGTPPFSSIPVPTASRGINATPAYTKRSNTESESMRPRPVRRMSPCGRSSRRPAWESASISESKKARGGAPNSAAKRAASSPASVRSARRTASPRAVGASSRSADPSVGSRPSATQAR